MHARLLFSFDVNSGFSDDEVDIFQAYFKWGGMGEWVLHVENPLFVENNVFSQN